MKTLKQFIAEKNIINPDVSWVDALVRKVRFSKAAEDVETLADMLSHAFSKRKISFDGVTRGSFGRGAFKDTQSAKLGLAGAEWQGIESDPQIIVTITKNAAKLPAATPEWIDRLKELIKHELIHAEQESRSKTGRIGFSPDGDDYYSDPHEIGAIASEMETQLLHIEPDKHKLIDMLRKNDPKLEKSSRYKLYNRAMKEDPVKFKNARDRMVKTLISRLGV